MWAIGKMFAILNTPADAALGTNDVPGTIGSSRQGRNSNLRLVSAHFLVSTSFNNCGIFAMSPSCKDPRIQTTLINPRSFCLSRKSWAFLQILDFYSHGISQVSSCHSTFKYAKNEKYGMGYAILIRGHMEFNKILNGVNIWAQRWPGRLVKGWTKVGPKLGPRMRR